MIEQAVLLGLAAWRMAALLAYERGPFNVFMRLRQVLGFTHYDSGEPHIWPDNAVGRLFSCVWCLGLWTAAAAYGLWQVEPLIVVVLAAAAVLVAVERFVRPEGNP